MLARANKRLLSFLAIGLSGGTPKGLLRTNPGVLAVFGRCHLEPALERSAEIAGIFKTQVQRNINDTVFRFR